MDHENAGGGDAPDASGGSPGIHRQNGAEQLVRMANDIGRFFGAEPDREDALAGVSNHLAKFWTQRMRDKLRAYLAQGGDELEPLPREALGRLDN